MSPNPKLESIIGQFVETIDSLEPVSNPTDYFGSYAFNEEVKVVMILKKDHTASEIIVRPPTAYKVDPSGRLSFAPLLFGTPSDDDYQYYGTIKDGVLSEDQGDYSNYLPKIE